MNSETVASFLYDHLREKEDFEISLENMYDLEAEDLENYDSFIMITSTWGEGEYPPDPEEFMDKVIQSSINIEGKPMAFVGLGDTSYEEFCGGIDKMSKTFTEDFNVKQVGEIHKIDGFPDDEILEKVIEWSDKTIESLQ